MSDNRHPTCRRDWSPPTSALAFTKTLLPGIPAVTFGQHKHADGVTGGGDEISAPQIVDGLQASYAGKRRPGCDQARGLHARGAFIGHPNVAAHLRSALFSGQALDVVAQFLPRNGDLESSADDGGAFGLMLAIRHPFDRTRRGKTIDRLAFSAAVPQPCIENAVPPTAPSAAAKHGRARFGTRRVIDLHNTSQATLSFQNSVPSSYANSTYHGTHAFGSSENGDLVADLRIRLIPWDGERHLSNDMQKAASREFLERTLMQRLARGPIGWDMVMTIGEAGDPISDPIRCRSADGKEVKVGTLAIASILTSTEVAGYGIDGDWLVQADGAKPSANPAQRLHAPFGASPRTRGR